MGKTISDIIFLLIMSSLLPFGIWGLFDLERAIKLFEKRVCRSNAVMTPDRWNKFVLRASFSISILIGFVAIMIAVAKYIYGIPTY